MHDSPLDPAASLGPEYYELALELLRSPASFPAGDLPNLPALVAGSPEAASRVRAKGLSLSELRGRLEALSTAQRVALITDAERRSAL